MKILILCCSLFACALAHADLPLGSEFTGKYWNSLDEKSKPVFLTGFCVGANGKVSLVTSRPAVDLYPEDIPKLIPLVDAFYKTHSNPFLLVHYAVEICTMQLRGRPQTEIDELIKRAEKAWK